ncbi:hypothetical protein D3C73_1399110 [compost metagenome]
MADADDTQARQLIDQRLVQRRLVFFIHRRSRFVHVQPLRCKKQRAGKGQALLLARREHALPVIGFVETRHQVRQTAGFQDVHVALVRVSIARLWITQRFAQRANR